MGKEELEKLDGWFERYAGRMVLYARQWVDSAEAEDVVQDVFVRMIRDKQAPANPAAWLYTSVRNAAISLGRSRTRRAKREKVVGEGRGRWFEPDMDAAIDAGAAEAALSKLPEAQREIVMLRLWGQLSFAEISGVMGMALSSVFDQYHKGLKGLRSIMENPACPRKMR